MKIIGVTGGIGSGKSTVSKILSDLGAFIIDADKIAKSITLKGQPALDELVEYFGTDIIDINKELNRNKLADIVFNDKEKLRILNAITHKYIIDEITKTINKLKIVSSSTNAIVLDAPIPVKHGFLDIVDEVWVVSSNIETRIKRIMERNQTSYNEALKRVKAQINEDEYLKIATKIINNNGTLEELKKNVTKMYKES